jgi:hypothetical protein
VYWIPNPASWLVDRITWPLRMGLGFKGLGRSTDFGGPSARMSIGSLRGTSLFAGMLFWVLVGSMRLWLLPRTSTFVIGFGTLVARSGMIQRSRVFIMERHER